VPLIYGYTIAANGALTPIAGSPRKNVMAPAYSMVIEDSFLYDPGSMSVWKIGTKGALTQIQGSPFKTTEMFGNNPSWIAFKQVGFAIQTDLGHPCPVDESHACCVISALQESCSLFQASVQVIELRITIVLQKEVQH
jgi:hypothetical protein